MHGYDYISFRYKTDDLRGDLVIMLNKGLLKAGRKTESASTYIEVSPGSWRHVILPFSQFLKDYVSDKSRVIAEIEQVFDPSFLDSIAIGYENNRLQGAGFVMLLILEHVEELYFNGLKMQVHLYHC